MVLSKVIRKSRSKLNKYRRILLTKLQRLFGTSDKSRWSREKSFYKSWDERTKLLAEQVKPNSKVYEFGAARLVLKDMLPESCIYLHSDMVKRNEETNVVDLNKSLPVIPKVDYVIFSGVLEYIFEVEKLIDHLSQFTDHFVLSYATIDAFPDKKVRSINGWVSALSIEDINGIAIKLGWECHNFDSWKDQSLFIFKR